MILQSAAFTHEGEIPAKYSCKGRNVSPPLRIQNVPPTARSLVLICEDPDAPGRTFQHWLSWDIDPGTSEIPEATEPGTPGQNDFGKAQYGGPCPPSGTHRYYFRLYALDTALGLPKGAARRDLDRAMQDHVLAEAELMGTFPA
ncbi:MAG: YbhB/YbcL family Raf kinase inhibitor-like protein [Spirochaetota bacterium]